MTATPLPTTSIDYDPVETTGAGRFRVQVGRYKERWYTDPLPGCVIAPASDWQGPSVSTIKKASGSDWSNTTIRRIAHALLDQPHRFDGLDADTIADQMRRINRDGLNAAGNRGTGVHTIAEHMLTGQTAMFIDPAAEPYRPALEAWFDKYQPRLILAEFACFNRELHGHGFGGTADALLEIDGSTYLVDWKSRGERHTVYAQEAAQLGGYALAEYVIGANDQHRRPLPKIDAGLIVSITPDGCRTYPIDLDKAADKFTDLHAWWVSRRTERDPIGKAWPTVTPQPQVAVEVDGFDAPQVAAPPTPSGVEQPAATDDETHGNAASSVAAPRWRLGYLDAPFVRLAEPPDEGLLNVDAAALRERSNRLDGAQRAWIANIVRQSKRAGGSLHMGESATARRLAACTALVDFAAAFIYADQDDTERHDLDAVLRAALARVIEPDAAHAAAHPVGAIIAALHAGEAQAFADVVARTCSLELALGYRDDGRPVLVAPAA